MKKNFKKLISIILLLVIIASVLSTTVSARYQYIGILGVGLSIDPSSGWAACSGYLVPSNYSTSNYLTVELQKSYMNTWVKDTSWIDSSTNGHSITIGGYKYVARGTYRVVATAWIYNAYGTLLEKEDIISYVVTY